ncbi:MAG: C1 family peptidase [Pirellulaceae bacterium]
MDVICNFSPPGLGWYQSLQDFRDYTPACPRAQELLQQLSAPDGTSLPDSVDLREYFPGVQDQLRLNSSSVHAAVALVEYFRRRALGKMVGSSRLFLYHTARKLVRIVGDQGVDLRSTFKAMQCFGVPPEEYWPYELEREPSVPDAFLYSFGKEYQAMMYVRLDIRNSSGSQTLNRVRAFLRAGFPVAFGFPVPSSLTADCDIPYRPAFDSIRGGQAAVCVGYDNRRLGATRGALLLRNSWGSQWGDGGHGWLPYRYVEEQLATDFWTLLHPDWLASGEFQRPLLG